ncbi:hypothetical protein KCP73_10920 [Salmonella enterica subsp. enterica]|nr:hypothetical protein KCP73_10920 [Salmonella enterica subsp. enterica]
MNSGCRHSQATKRRLAARLTAHYLFCGNRLTNRPFCGCDLAPLPRFCHHPRHVLPNSCHRRGNRHRLSLPQQRGETLAKPLRPCRNTTALRKNTHKYDVSHRSGKRFFSSENDHAP